MITLTGARVSGEIFEIDLERSGELLQRGNTPGLMSSLNRCDHTAGDFGHFGELLLSQRAMITPDSNRVFTGAAALGNFNGMSSSSPWSRRALAAS